MKSKTILPIFIILIAATSAFAQTTEFSYQGNLKDGVNPANGNYDFEFRLFDAVSGGNQIGAISTRSNLVVTNGIFSVALDFGNQFPGANRFLEIRMRNAGGGGFTILDPRQKVSSSPYALQSVNAATASNAVQLGGVAANQYVVTTDPRLADARNPTAGNSNYIQNQSAGAQASSNFNISGNGTTGGTLSGNVVNAATQYKIAGLDVLRTAGVSNVFVGFEAGLSTTAMNNSFFGRSAGKANTNGSNNSFFGYVAGFANTTGDNNSFFGHFSGVLNSTGGNNSFVGRNAGNSNTTGGNNTIIGDNADVASSGLTFATAIGASSVVSTSNTVVLGRSADTVSIPGTQLNLGGSRFLNNAGTQNTFAGVNTGAVNTGADNSFFGFVAGDANVGGADNSFFGSDAGGANTTGNNNTFIGSDAGDANTTGSNNTLIGRDADVASGGLSYATAIGSDATASLSNSIYLGRSGGQDTVRIAGPLSLNGNLTFASGGVASINGSNIFMPGLNAGIGTSLCLSSNRVITCSSSLRYKTNINRFGFGMSLINQLKPITFDWKDGGMHDLGLGAEDVAAIEPLLVTYNAQGQVEGVKYDRVGVVLINAVKEQQEQISNQQTAITSQQNQIEQQRKLIETQQGQIDSMKKFICLTNKDADFCKE